MKYSTINVSAESKEKFNVLKRKYSIKTDDDTLDRICDFMLFNKISVKDFASLQYDKNLSDELKRHIDKRHDWITKNDQSLRNYIGKFSNEYWKDTLKSVLEIKAFLIDKDFTNDKNNYESDNSQVLLKDKEIDIKRDDFSSEALSNLEDEYRLLLEKFKSLDFALKKIKSNHKIESVGMMGKKQIVITLPLEEWENLIK